MVSLLAMMAAQVAMQRIEIPPAAFNAPNAMFTCVAAGLPTVGIDYDQMHREMDFGIYSSPVTTFRLVDPVKSVVYEGDSNTGRWIVLAEGRARSARGRIAEDTPVRIELVIHRGGGADFTVRAGEFTQTGTGCGRAPNRSVPGHGLPLRSAPGQTQ